jgi:hypothetical protein
MATKSDSLGFQLAVYDVDGLSTWSFLTLKKRSSLSLFIEQISSQNGSSRTLKTPFRTTPDKTDYRTFPSVW